VLPEDQIPNNTLFFRTINEEAKVQEMLHMSRGYPHHISVKILSMLFLEFYLGFILEAKAEAVTGLKVPLYVNCALATTIRTESPTIFANRSIALFGGEKL
jgi:hypothetical protein